MLLLPRHLLYQTNSCLRWPRSNAMTMFSHSGRKFSCKSSLERHMKSNHQQEMKCEECFKVFEKKSSLNAHIKTHSFEKPYDCTQCTQKFSLKIHQEKHEKNHEGKEMLVHCSTCSKKVALQVLIQKLQTELSGIESHHC